MTDDPHLVDPDYDKHGGFPNFQAADPGPGFGRFLTAMRRAQDLAVSADPDSETWEQAADRAEELVMLLDPFEAAEGVGPASRVPSLPGSLLATSEILGGKAAMIRAIRFDKPRCCSSQAEHFAGSQMPSHKYSPHCIIVPRWQRKPKLAEWVVAMTRAPATLAALIS